MRTGLRVFRPVEVALPAAAELARRGASARLRDELRPVGEQLVRGLQGGGVSVTSPHLSADSSHHTAAVLSQARALFDCDDAKSAVWQQRDNAPGYYRYVAALPGDNIEAWMCGPDLDAPGALREPYYRGSGLPAEHYLPYLEALSNRWPQQTDAVGGESELRPEDFRLRVAQYYRACHLMCLDALTCIAATLSDADLSVVSGGNRTEVLDAFAALHGKADDVLELKRYPPVSAEWVGQERVAAHKDLTTLSVLASDAEGFEVGLESSEGAGEWLPLAELPPGAVFVQGGELLERWTSGAIPAAAHRVVVSAAAAAGQSRHSAVYFCTPDWDAEVRPFGPGPDREEPFRAGDVMPLSVPPPVSRFRGRFA